MDQWNPDEKVDLTSDSIQKYKEQIAKNVKLPGNTQEWVEVLRNLDIFRARRLLKKERSTLPAKYKKLYRQDDSVVLKALHTMRLQAPFFSEQEKRKSQLFLEFEQAKEQGIEHPAMNQRPF